MTDFNAVDGYYPTALRWAYFVVMDEPRMSPFGYKQTCSPLAADGDSYPLSRHSSSLYPLCASKF